MRGAGEGRASARRVSGLAIALALAAVQGQAQPLSRVCQTLATRLEQSPVLRERRLLDEALFEAAELDCPPIAVDLLDRGADVMARNRSGTTALGIAAEAGAEEIVGDAS